MESAYQPWRERAEACSLQGLPDNMVAQLETYRDCLGRLPTLNLDDLNANGKEVLYYDALLDVTGHELGDWHLGIGRAALRFAGEFN